MNTRIEFGRNDTKAVKGIAVLMMLFCHLVASPDRFPAGFEGFCSMIPGFVENGYLTRLGFECGLCVPFFFFLGGYGLYLRMQKQGFSLKDTIIKLYISYWKIFFIFVPIGFLFFAREGVDISQYSTRFSKYHGLELITVLISDFTGLTCPLNGDWWFFLDYLCILPLGYLFIKSTKKIHDFWANFMLVLAADFFIRGIVPVMPNLTLFSNIQDNILYTYFMRFSTLSPYFFAGIVMAKYNGICKIKELLLRVPFHTILSMIGSGSIVILRSFVFGENMDIIFTSLMIPMISVILDKLSFLKKFFIHMGNHSTNMWLCHGFFCFYFLEFTKLVYATRNILVNFAVLVSLSWIASVLTNVFYTLLGKWENRLKKPVHL